MYVIIIINLTMTNNMKNHHGYSTARIPMTNIQRSHLPEDKGLLHLVKNLLPNVGDSGSIPESGRLPGEGNGYPLQHSCQENPMDRGAWWAIQSMELQDQHFHLT